MPPKTVRFKVHEDKEGKTVDLNVRISIIDNGCVIKAGGPPFFCEDEKTVRAKIDELLAQFFSDQAARKKA
jgi:hypothetical protein